MNMEMSMNGQSTVNPHASHSGMDMNQLTEKSHSMSMMKMYFHFGDTEVVVFDFWRISTVAGLVGSCAICFLIAFLYEGLKALRQELFERDLRRLRSSNIRHKDSRSSGLGSDGPAGVGDSPGVAGSSSYGTLLKSEQQCSVPAVSFAQRSQIIEHSGYRMFSMPHVIQSLMHVLQVAIGYLLMLIVMTYNVWLFVAVIIGAMIGYFVFGWRQAVNCQISDMAEHCS